MKAIGLRPITYRLRTELGVEAWHWNPVGTWSDPKHRQGYWLSDPQPKGQIDVTNGYWLPRRGDTVDQANNRGYSRLDDGDPNTFWKSNPYLDRHFTRESNLKHPQWVVIDFGEKTPVSELQIQWAAPYAKKVRVEYWNGEPRVDEVDPPVGDWTTFPGGDVTGGVGGDQKVSLSPEPIKAEYVRIWLQDSSNTALPGSHDIRDSLGYAIREIKLGVRVNGQFRDAIAHRRDAQQTEMIVSSTDPWHRATDRDPDVEQPGFDLIERTGMTRGLSMLIPVPVLYGVPEDAARELQWFRGRGYPVRAVEMGEEPDGQMANPEDYANLYLQAARAIRRVAPRAVLGGPCLQTTQHEFRDWPDPHGTPWLVRFFRYLHERRALTDLGFFSFEWYPFDDVAADPFPQLADHARLFSTTIARLKSQGLNHSMPWMITEYGYSAFAGPSEVEIPGAILNADIVGEFLTMGGGSSFLYGYEPGEVIREKTGAYGNLMDLLSVEDGAPIRLPTFYSAWLTAHIWCGPANQVHRFLKTDVDDRLTGAYSVIRPDGHVAILLVNRSRDTAAQIHLNLSGRATVYRYGTAQYAWKSAGENGHPTRSLPPKKTREDLARGIPMPPCSLAVVVQ